MSAIVTEIRTEDNASGDTIKVVGVAWVGRRETFYQENYPALIAAVGEGNAATLASAAGWTV